MRNIVGAPVQGLDFFGREHELGRLHQDAQNQHVLLLAPRRVGKTSLLLALAQRLTDTGEMIAVYASVKPMPAASSLAAPRALAE